MDQKIRAGKRICLRYSLFVLAVVLISPAIGYAEYPRKPITVVVGFPPGGPADLGARVMGESLRKSLGVPVVVKNQPGAGGIVAAAAVAKAEPDGYTLLWTTIGAVTSLATRSDLKYSLDDLTPIAKTMSFPGVVAVPADSPFKEFNQLIDYLKKNPGKLRMGSDGVGSSPHLNWTILESQGGLNMIHAPYKGAGPNSTDLLGGRLDFSITVLGPAIIPSMNAGAVRALAFFSGRRSTLFPSVPTTKELGYAESARTSWQGYMGPAGLPAAVLSKLEGPVKKAVGDPEVAKALAKFGLEPDYQDAEKFKTFVYDELNTYKAIAEKFNLKE